MSSEKRIVRSPLNPALEWCIDFLSPAYQHRLRKRTRKNDALARALGLHKKSNLRVLDMSGGLGKDAYWIAHCGATVTLLERHPLLAEALQEAITLLRADGAESNVGHRMTLIHTDATSFLETINPGDYDVAYYDPMFMPRRKSALVKKDMQIMHDLLGAESPSDLCERVLQKIPCLVVKRAKADPAYHPTIHNDVFTGTTRYEVYRKI